MIIYCDNISSILLTYNPIYHVKTKHIEMHYNFIKEKVLIREIDLIHVNNKNHVFSIFHTGFKYRQVIKIQKDFWCIKCGLELEWQC
jgi:histone deacetylase 1/2